MPKSNPECKLIALSTCLRRTKTHEAYKHGRSISASGTPYLHFKHFNIVYMGTKREFRLFWHSDQSKEMLHHVPKRNYGGSEYAQKAAVKLADRVKRMYFESQGYYHGSL